MAPKDLYPKKRESQPSLVDVLNGIESTPPYLGVDTRTLVLRAFDEWEKQSDLVRRVRQGETTFKAQYEALFGNHDGAQVLYPHFIGDGREERRRDAGAVFGFGESSYHNANFFNPVSGGGFGAVSMGVLAAGIRLLDHISSTSPHMTRREFLHLTGGVGGGMAVFGVVGSLAIASDFKNLKQNAAYLDEMHQKYGQHNRPATTE